MTDDLAAKERQTFRAAVDTGLWDILIASVVAMFAIAPMLSGALGDFWSSAIFIPVWGGVYLLVRFLSSHVVVPRVGVVRFGSERQARLRRFGLVLAAVNVAALLAGVFAATRAGTAGLWVFPITFSLIVLVIFSLVAYATDIPRFFYYGVMLAVSPLIGEWLFRQGYALHHGFPVMFGLAAAVIALIGMTKFALLVRTHPPVNQGPATAGTFTNGRCTRWFRGSKRRLGSPSRCPCPRCAAR